MKPSTIGAYIITYTILEASYYNYSIIGPENPIFIVQAHLRTFCETQGKLHLTEPVQIESV